MAQESSSHSIAVFTALGTIVGYLGTEVASVSVFDRLLWPSRYYNDLSITSFVGTTLLLPYGGPIHKAAVLAFDRFYNAGLFEGRCRGDMLGTPFFNDTGLEYIVHHRASGSNQGIKVETRAARNAVWIRVMQLIAWTTTNIGQANVPNRDHQIRGPQQMSDQVIRAQRPVSVLTLSWVAANYQDESVTVSDDINSLKFHHLRLIIASELVTLLCGFTVAVVWKSFFAVWFLLPLLLKVIAAIFSVRRKALNARTMNDIKNTAHAPPLDTEDSILCQLTNFDKGFFLIKGPAPLVRQFFRHYGHPDRYRAGLRGDRTRELIEMILVVLHTFVYPSGLLAFIYAPQKIQWVWLGYQLYCMVAMHGYRYFNGHVLGSTEYRMARLLGRNGRIIFSDGNGNRVLAIIKIEVVSKVDEGKKEVQLIIDNFRNQQSPKTERTELQPTEIQQSPKSVKNESQITGIQLSPRSSQTESQLMETQQSPKPVQSESH